MGAGRALAYRGITYGAAFWAYIQTGSGVDEDGACLARGSGGWFERPWRPIQASPTAPSAALVPAHLRSISRMCLPWSLCRSVWGIGQLVRQSESRQGLDWPSHAAPLHRSIASRQAAASLPHSYPLCTLARRPGRRGPAHIPRSTQCTPGGQVVGKRPAASGVFMQADLCTMSA